MVKKKISSHVLLGATLLSSANPGMVEAKAEMRESSPSIEQVVEAKEKNDININVESETGEKTKNKKKVNSFASIDINQSKIEEPLSTVESPVEDETQGKDESITTVRNNAESLTKEVTVLWTGFWGTAPVTFDSEGTLTVGQGLLNKEVDKVVPVSEVPAGQVVRKVVLTAPVILPPGVAGLFESYSHYGGVTSELEAIEGLSFLDTSQATTMNSMFYGFKGTSLDLSNFDSTGVLNGGDIACMNQFLANVTRLKELKLGEKFSFVGWNNWSTNPYPVNLRNPGSMSGFSYELYTGSWQNVGTGTADAPNGSHVFLSQDLVLNYDGASMADTYVWQPRPLLAAPVTVNYLDELGNEISPSISLNGNVGEKYNTEELPIEGYTVKEVQGNATGLFSAEAQEVNYIYSKNPVLGHHVVVKYQDEKGNILLPDIILNGFVGETYTSEKKEIDGYTFKEVQGQVSNVFGHEEQIIIYVYTKNPVLAKVVTVKYQDEEGKTLLPDITLNGFVGETYTSEEKDIKGYSLKEVQGTKTGQFSEEEQTVTYIYKKKTIHEEIQIKDVELKVSPGIAWLDENSEVRPNMFRPHVEHPISHEELDEEDLHNLGITLRLEWLSSPKIGENKVKIVMSNGSEEKEALTVLYLGEPQVRILDSKFIKASESHDMSLVNLLAQSTIDVVADFGEAHPEKDGLSLKVKDFKATQYDQKNKVTLSVNLGESSTTLEAEGALNLGEEGWVLSNQRHYGVDVSSVTYMLGSVEHRLANHDTLVQHIKLYQATPGGRQELSTSQAADFLSFKAADVAAFKISNKSGAHAIAFEFGKKEGVLQNQREGQATLIVNLVDYPVSDKPNTPPNPESGTTYNTSKPTVTTHSKSTSTNTNTEQSRQKLGEFGSKEQKILGTLGTFALIGSALLVWLKKWR